MTTAHHPPVRPPAATVLPATMSIGAPARWNVDVAALEGHADALLRYQQLGFAVAEAEDLEYKAGLFHLRRGLSLHAAGVELNAAAVIAEQRPGGLELFVERSQQKAATVDVARLVAAQFTAEEANLLSIMAWIALFREGQEKGLLLARTLLAERQNGNLEPDKQDIETRLKRLRLPATAVHDQLPAARSRVAPAVGPATQPVPVAAHERAVDAGTDAATAPPATMLAVDHAAPTLTVTGDAARPAVPAGQITSARALPVPPAPPAKKGSTGKRPTAQARQAAGPLRPLIAPDMELPTFAALATAYARELLSQTAASVPDPLPTVTINQAELSLAVSLLRQSNLFRNQLNQSWQRATMATDIDEEDPAQAPGAPEDGDEAA